MATLRNGCALLYFFFSFASLTLFSPPFFQTLQWSVAFLALLVTFEPIPYFTFPLQLFLKFLLYRSFLSFRDNKKRRGPCKVIFRIPYSLFKPRHTSVLPAEAMAYFRTGFFTTSYFRTVFLVLGILSFCKLDPQFSRSGTNIQGVLSYSV